MIMMMFPVFPPWYRRAFYNTNIYIYDKANIYTNEPVRDKTNKMDQHMDFCVLVFFDRMDNAL